MDYLGEQGDTVARNEPYLRSGGNRELMRTVGAWASQFGEVLNVGCGGFMPLLVKTTHALDITPVAERLLRKNGWTGPFTLGSVTELPFHAGQFEAGICCEVVEHLETPLHVEQAFYEMDRVCRAWLVSTPCVKTGEPTHRRVIEDGFVDWVMREFGASSVKMGLWWYIWKGGAPVGRPAAGLPEGCWHG